MSGMAIKMEHVKNSPYKNQITAVETLTCKIYRRWPIKVLTDVERGVEEKALEQIIERDKDENKNRLNEYVEWSQHFRKNLEIMERKDNMITKIDVQHVKRNKVFKEWTIEKGAFFTRHRGIRYGRIRRQRCVVEGFFPYDGKEYENKYIKPLQVKIRFITNNRTGRSFPYELRPWGHSMNSEESTPWMKYP